MTGKFVFLNPEIKLVSLKIDISEQLMCGGEFRVLDKENTKTLESFKFNADWKNPFEKIIKTPISHLNFSYLVWQILICSNNKTMSDVAIRIGFFQDGKECSYSTIKPVFNSNNIAPCALKNPNKYEDSIIFVLKS